MIKIMEQVHIMETEEEAPKPPEDYPAPGKLPGKLIIRFLQQKKSGATMREIVQFLSKECGKDTEELTSSVVTTLENGAALGFLERKGSHYLNWAVREACCRKRRRRRSSCRRRRRRSCRRRRRSCCRRRRRSCRRKRRRRCWLEDLPDPRPKRVTALKTMKIKSGWTLWCFMWRVILYIKSLFATCCGLIHWIIYYVLTKDLNSVG